MSTNEAADRLHQWINGGGPHLELQEVRDLFHEAVAIMPERSAGAEPLDVRTLAKALHNLGSLDDAEWVAAEYARIAKRTDR